MRIINIDIVVNINGNDYHCNDFLKPWIIQKFLSASSVEKIDIQLKSLIWIIYSVNANCKIMIFPLWSGGKSICSFMFLGIRNIPNQIFIFLKEDNRLE